MKKLLLLLVIVIAIFNIALVKSVFATSDKVSWSGDDIQIDISTSTVGHPTKRCIDKQITVIDLEEGAHPGSQYAAEGCVYRGKTFHIATYRHKNTGLYLTGIKLDSNESFITISNIVPQQKINVADSSNRISFYSYSDSNHILSSVKDASSSLEILRTNSLNQPIMYGFKADMTKKWFEWNPEGNPSSAYKEVSSISYSLNGRYAVAWIGYNGHIKIDFDEDEAYVVSDVIAPGYITVHSPTAAGISNDGRFVFIGPVTATIDTNDCGYKLTTSMLDNPFVQSNLAKGGCKSEAYDLPSIIGYNGRGLDYEWIGDEEGLRFTINPWPHTEDQSRLPSLVTIWGIKAEPYNYKLDYLALGDSYSSGEGDIGKQANGLSYYTPGTNGVNGCHISTRSYPFLLAGLTSLQGDRMQSVACSGARIAKDYYGAQDGYLGQRNQMRGWAEEAVIAERTDTLKNFNPGFIKQIEFVRANKPKVVSVTGGGNDVGFAELLSYCALPSGVGHRSNTCDQAIANTAQRSLLGDSIRSQYEILVGMIESIKEASEKTTVYVVGYPSFASESYSTCANSLSLNQAERATINESISYLNEVLSQASKTAGAKYVDIESSLNGGRICEGSEYMTGPLNVLGFDIQDRKPEMFHPNSEGHSKMAEAIKNRNFELKPESNPVPQTVVAPTKPSTFGNSEHVPTFKEKLVVDGLIQSGKTLQFAASPGLFAIKKLVTFTMWSSPKKLGSYSTGSDGVLAASTKLPSSIKPGYHMLVAEGQSPDGNPVRYYQYLEVRSGVVNDRDGDGIKDDKDSCQYIKHWYDETTNKDVCKVSTLPRGSKGKVLNHGGSHHDSNHDHVGWLDKYDWAKNSLNGIYLR